VLGVDGSQKGALQLNFDRAIMVDFQGAKIISDTGFLPIDSVKKKHAYHIFNLHALFMVSRKILS